MDAPLLPLRGALRATCVPPPRKQFIPIARPNRYGPVVGYVLCEHPWSCYSHWCPDAPPHGRRVYCAATSLAPCPFCHLERRWGGLIALLQAKPRRTVVIQVTEYAAQNCPPPYFTPAMGSLRGLWCELDYAFADAKRAMSIRFTPATATPFDLPASPTWKRSECAC